MCGVPGWRSPYWTVTAWDGGGSPAPTVSTTRTTSESTASRTVSSTNLLSLVLHTLSTFDLSIINCLCYYEFNYPVHCKFNLGVYLGTLGSKSYSYFYIHKAYRLIFYITPNLVAVRVVGGVKNSHFMMGRVEVRQEATGQDWRTVCADGINQAEANVICREVHYDRAIMLAPSFFGSLTISQVSKYIADIKCKGNETSITDCLLTTEAEGKCSIAHYNYASVLCVKNSDKDQCKIYFKCILMYTI